MSQYEREFCHKCEHTADCDGIYQMKWELKHQKHTSGFTCPSMDAIVSFMEEEELDAKRRLLRDLERDPSYARWYGYTGAGKELRGLVAKCDGGER